MPLAELNSAKALFAVVFGIPVAVLLAATVWLIPAGRTAMRAGVTVVLAVLVGFGVWTVFRSSGQRAEATPPLIAPSSNASAPPIVGPPPGTPSIQPTQAPSPAQPPQPACQPAGSQITIAAKNIQFDKKCLAAPANKPFSIRFTNDDPGVPHNVAILSGQKQLFMGEIVTGPKSATYQVKGLPAGSYTFHCDVHPQQMNGVFVSK